MKIFLTSTKDKLHFIENLSDKFSFTQENIGLQYVEHREQVWSKSDVLQKKVVGMERFSLFISVIFRAIFWGFGACDKNLKKDWKIFLKGKDVRVIYLPKENIRQEEDGDLQTIKASNGKTIVIRPALPIRNLVLQGGGAKGIVYPTYIKVLNRQNNFLDNLRQISGTSAGALMALLIAAGVGIEEVETFLSKTNMFDGLRGDLPDYVDSKNGVFKAGNIYHILLDMVSKSVNAYLEDKMFESDWSKGEKKLKEDFSKEALSRFQANVDAKFLKGITFEDLAILSSLNPQKFKLLSITGFDSEKSEPVYFNFESTPEVLCHSAVHSSMAIPIIIQGVSHNGRMITDGSERSNLSTEIFKSQYSSDEERFYEETLALIFSKNGRSYDILHKMMPEKLKKIEEIELKNPLWLFQRISNFYHSKEFNKKKIYELGGNVAVVPHGNLRTLSFMASSAQIKKAKEEAFNAAMEFVEQRRQQASYEELKEAF